MFQLLIRQVGNVVSEKKNESALHQWLDSPFVDFIIILVGKFL